MLAINLCTRERPQFVIETIERTLPNITLPDTALMVSVDDDDEQTIHALDPYLKRDHGVQVSIEPREDSVGAKFNRILKREPDATAYLAMVDYAPHVTHGFDRLILEAAGRFEDGIGVVYNHMANDSFPQINAVTKKWVEITGEFYPTYFPYWFIDHWLDDLARMTGRLSFADVWIDVSRQTQRQTIGMCEPFFWASYYDMLLLERREVADSVLAAMSIPEIERDRLRSLYPIYERRSCAINRTVRSDVVGTDGGNNSRYERLKALACAKSAVEIVRLRERRQMEPIPILDEMTLRQQVLGQAA